MSMYLHRIWSATFGVFLLVLIYAGSVHAEQLAGADGHLANGTRSLQDLQEEKVVISFNNADAMDVIRWASDLTEKNIIVSDKIKNKRITVVSGEPMTKKEAYEVFLAVMQVNDLVVVETDNALKIFQSTNAKDNAIPMIDDENSSDEDFVISIIKIKNVSAQQLLALLRPLVPSTSQFQVHADTNMLLIADYKANVEKITRLIEQIDKAGTVDVEFIPLKHASAKEVVELLSSLAPKIISGAEDGSSNGKPLNFAADERSNSILMSGDTVLRSQMKKLIEKLDQPLVGEGNTQVVYLNYADAKEMAEMLTGISASIVESDKDKKAPATQGNNQVKIIASESNNALVITAPPSVLNTVKSVIERLDVRREQVLVEALLVEVNEDVGRKLGLVWATDTTQMGGRGLGTFLPPETPYTLEPPGGGDNNLLSGLGLIATYYRNGNLRGILQVIETVAESNVLSTPTLLALDNEEAEILVGENVPFVTGETTDLSGSNSRVSIERQDIGLHLKVKAKINLNDTLTLDIEQKVESISDTAEEVGATDIITNKRQLKTKAIVNDGEILVLGGLIRDEAQETESKVPFLGDIPGLGWLFKGTRKSMVKKNLMILIHPKIIRDKTDSVKESVEAYNKMRALEQYYNENRDALTIRRHDLPLLKELPESMLPSGAVMSSDAADDSQKMAPPAAGNTVETTGDDASPVR